VCVDQPFSITAPMFSHFQHNQITTLELEHFVSSVC
jgi:hypothetical protein